jgi:hypothetical protein
MRAREGVIGECYINIGLPAEQPNNTSHPKAIFLRLLTSITLYYAITPCQKDAILRGGVTNSLIV